MSPKKYVFTPPGDRITRPGAWEVCLLGWCARKDELICPKKRRKCELICIRVGEISPGLCPAIVSEAGKCDASGVFLDGDLPPPGLCELASELCREGLRVFSPFELPSPGLLVTPDRGEHRFLRPRQQKTLLRPGGPGKSQELSKEELSHLQEKYAPAASFSQELGAFYFTVKSKNGTLFVVYDTPDTFRRRIANAECQSIFLSLSSVRDYLGGRL